MNSTHRDPVKTGSLYNHVPIREILIPPNTWFTQEVEAVGNHIVIKVNGKVTVDYVDPKKTYTEGHFAFQHHDPGCHVQTRKIEVNELTRTNLGSKITVATEGGVSRRSNGGESLDKAQEGFVRLFNGKDLNGWVGEREGYEVRAGAIRSKPGKRATIFFPQEFSDFKARVEFRLSSGANSGLAIRYPGQGDPSVTGMCEVQILDDESPQYDNLDSRQYNGSVYGVVAAKRGHLRPLGQWNIQVVEVRGSKIKVELNGAMILDADLSQIHSSMKNIPHPGKDRTSGYFGLTGVDGPVEFRTIEMRELGLKGEDVQEAAVPSKTSNVSGTTVEKRGASRTSARHPADSKLFLGKHYKVFRQQLSWHEARAKCLELGGYLAVVTNDQQNHFLTSLVRDTGLDAAWLGATDEQVEGRWVWVGFEPMRYSNWSSIGGQQPNNKQGLEHYLVLLVSHGGKWSDQPANSVQHQPGFVCEWD